MESDYDVHLASIASLEGVGDFVEAKRQRFALLESFSGLLHSLASHGEELSETELKDWKVFKAQLIKLVTTRNRTRVEVRDRLTPLIESIKPLLRLRYFDKEELSIFVKQKFLDPRLIEFIDDIEKTKQMLASKDKKLSECEQILTRAISRMEREDDSYSLCPDLAHAHCLRALCRQEEDLCRKEEDPKSNSNRIMQDAHHALVYWDAMPTLPKKHLHMLCHLHDLLSLKGNTLHHGMIYELMLKSFDSKSKDESQRKDESKSKNGLKDWCHKLWRSRRVSHTFCGSPVCEVFLKRLSKYCGWYNDGETWKSGMNDIDAVGFQHKLALSSYVPYNQDSPGDLSINQVQQVATNQLQSVSRLLGILYTLDRVPTGHNVAPSVAQWTSFFHNSSIGAYFNNSLIDRMRKEEGQKPTEDNTEGNLEEWVLQFFKKLPQLPIICFSMYGEDFLLPSNILPSSPTSVWIQLSRLGSDKVPIFVSIIPIESSLKDTVYRDLRVKVPRRPKKGNPTALDKVASVFNSVYEVKDMLFDELAGLRSKTWMKLLRKLDDYVSAILRVLQTSSLDTRTMLYIPE
ncbi:hypothetical protein Tco_0518291 [Tanacetum coccineum]